MLIGDLDVYTKQVSTPALPLRVTPDWFIARMIGWYVSMFLSQYDGF